MVISNVALRDVERGKLEFQLRKNMILNSHMEFDLALHENDSVLPVTQMCLLVHLSSWIVVLMASSRRWGRSQYLCRKLRETSRPSS